MVDQRRPVSPSRQCGNATPPHGTMKMAQSKDTKKPDARPKCGSEKVASILYGLPMLDEELKRRLNAGEVTLGGC